MLRSVMEGKRNRHSSAPSLPSLDGREVLEVLLPLVELGLENVDGPLGNLKVFGQRLELRRQLRELLVGG